MKLTVQVQGKNGRILDELVIEVSDDMTKTGLVEALNEEGILASTKYEVLVALDDSDSFSAPILRDGSLVIIREPKSIILPHTEKA